MNPAHSKEFIKTTLKNGLRVVMIPRPNSLATTVLVLVEAGSKYETKDINGLSHFLEHMCFKGTTKRPRAIDIAGELDSIGSEYNAFTSQEWTGYFAKAQAKHAGKILDVVSDLYLNPVFDEKEIEKEKGVVIEELNMYEDTPQRKVADLFLELLYGDQPAGWDVGGKKEIIRQLNREDFIKYRGQHYVAEATLVVVAGKFDEKMVLKEIDKHFANISTGDKTGKVKTVESQAKPEVMVRHKASDQTHLIIGCRAFSAFDPRKYALDILADALGGGMSSRLFQKVREELGAAYYIRAGSDLFTDHGYLAVSAGVEHSKLEIVIKAILGELKRVADGDFSEPDLAHGKDHITGKLMLGLETSDEIAMFYGGQEILERELKNAGEISAKINAVTRQDVIDIAKDIFRNEKLNMALIGPYKDKAVFEKILKF
jgi:predicted Zn-dependent peptidase